MFQRMEISVGSSSGGHMGRPSRPDPHLSARQDVSSQLDLGEVALPNGFEEPVVADVRLLRLLGASGPDAGPGRARARLLAAVAVRRVLREETKRFRHGGRVN